MRLASTMGQPSPEYLSKMGEQPDPDMPEDSQAKSTGPTAEKDDEDARMKKQIRSRSRKMSLWQIFLVTLIGSSALNIMREKNEAEELDDNYRIQFNKFEKILKALKVGDMVLEDVQDELHTVNDRFANLFHLPRPEFEGLRGLDREYVRELYHKYKGVPLQAQEDNQAPSKIEETEISKEKADASGGKLDTFL